MIYQLSYIPIPSRIRERNELSVAFYPHAAVTVTRETVYMRELIRTKEKLIITGLRELMRTKQELTNVGLLSVYSSDC